MTQQSKPETARGSERGRSGGYGYGGAGMNEPGESTFGELGAVVEPNPSASPRAGTHPVAARDEEITYTTDPVGDAVAHSQRGDERRASTVERGAHYEKGAGFALTRGVGSLFVYGGALLAVAGMLLAAFLQFAIAVPVLFLAVGLFYLGRRVTARSHEKAEEHFEPLRKR